MGSFKGSPSSLQTVTAVAVTADDLEIDAGTLSIDADNNNVGIGLTAPKTKLTVEGTLTLKEQANAESDTAAYGQIWVKSDSPNDLYFTNDAGNDVRITNGATLAAAASSAAVAADDITAGDAAISLSTTSGNITIDAQANDADVIIKVDDGGSPVTAVTFDGSDEGNAIFVNDLKLSSDASVIHWGANNEITLTHVHDVGLTITNTIADTDNTPVILTLKSEEDAIVADDVIGTINVTAGDSDGTDAAAIAASIEAVAEGTFGTNANATSIKFKTGDTAPASEKMRLWSDGMLEVAQSVAFNGAFQAVQGAGSYGVMDYHSNSIRIISRGSDGSTRGGIKFVQEADDGSPSTDTLTMDTSGNASFSANVTVGGVADITDTTDASDATGDTGALRCEGGASIAKKLYVGTDLDVDGTSNLDAVDIDGNTQMDGTLTVGVDDTGYDVKFFGATSGRFMEWDQSEDELRLPDDTQLRIGSSQDFSIKHTTDHTYLINTQGNLVFDNQDADNDFAFMMGADTNAVKFRVQNNSTRVAFQVDGEGDILLSGSANANATWDRSAASLKFNDNATIQLGDSQDFSITHKSSHSYFENTTGHIIIDNQANDKAVKVNLGTDTSATDFRVQGNSADSQLVFKADGAGDLFALQDGASFKFGADGEVTLTHVHNTGLLLSDASGVGTTKLMFGDSACFVQQQADGELGIDADSIINVTAPTVDIDASTAVTIDGPSVVITDSASAKPVVEIKNTHNGGTAGRLYFTNTEAGGAGSSGDDLGSLAFFGQDAGSNADQQYVGLLAEIDVATHGQESGKYSIKVASHDGGMEDGIIIVGGSVDAEVDVTIGKGAASVITVPGTMDIAGAVDIAGDLTLSAGGDGALVFGTAGQNSIKIPDNQASALIVEQADNAYMTFNTTDGQEAVQANQTLQILDDVKLMFGTDGNATIEYDEDGTDSLVIDVGAAPLVVTSTTSEKPTLELRNTTDGDTATGPLLQFSKKPGNNVGEADDVIVGGIQFDGIDSGNAATTYGQVVVKSSDKTGGDEGGLFQFHVMAGGTAGTAALTNVLSIGGEDTNASTPCEIVVNEPGNAFVDFRVESDNATHMLFVDAGNDGVSIGSSTDAPAGALEVSTADGSGAIALVVTHLEDTNDAIDIVADAVTTANVIDLTADALTSGIGVKIESTSNSLNGGSLLKASYTGNSTNAQSLVQIVNDHADAVSTTPLLIKQDGAVTGAAAGLPLINFTVGASGDEMVLRTKTISNITIANDTSTSVTDFFPINSLIVAVGIAVTTAISGNGLSKVGKQGDPDFFQSTVNVGDLRDDGDNKVYGPAAGKGAFLDLQSDLVLTHNAPGNTNGRVRATCWYYSLQMAT